MPTNKKFKGQDRKGTKPRGNNARRRNDNAGDVPAENRNDASWYHVDAKINSAIANLPFNIFPGTREINGFETIGWNDGELVDERSHSTPGVMRIAWCPSIGGGRSSVSAVNIAAKALYTWVRHQNSGHSNYDSPDLMIYVLAMDSIYSYYLELKRTLSLASSFEMTNRNIPRLLLAASKVDVDDLRANIANYRGRLNLLAAQICSLAVPNLFNIFRRHAALTSVVLTDSTSKLSQMYIYVMDYVMKFTPYESSKGGILTAERCGKDDETFGEKLDRLAELIEAVLSDEDMNIMSGDILKAFGRENLYSLATSDENATVELVYDENMLQQIENMHWLGSGEISGTITQEDNLLGQDLEIDPSDDVEKLATLEAVLANPTYFNSHRDDVTPDDCMEYSRNTLSVVKDEESAHWYLITGSELFTRVDVYTMYYPSSDVLGEVHRYRIPMVVRVDGYDGETLDLNPIRALSLLSRFDWHPFVYPVFNEGPTGDLPEYMTYALFDAIGDLKKYTVVPNEIRKSMHDVALMGELGALIISKFNSNR